MLDTTSRDNSTELVPVPVELQNVSFSIKGKKLIDNVSCKLAKTGKTVVMGANGAGKSLFLRLVAGLLKADSGQVRVYADQSDPSQEVCMSMVFQNPVLLRRSVYANVAYVLKQQKLSKQLISAKVGKALELALLERHAQTPARRLSGGEQQRLALARAMVVSPDILLLDEATANLDPASTHIVESMVAKVSNDGAKILFVTHDIRQAKRVADDILFFHEGRLMAHKPVKEFFRNPGSNEAQAYLDGRVPNQILQD